MIFVCGSAIVFWPSFLRAENASRMSSENIFQAGWYGRSLFGLSFIQDKIGPMGQGPGLHAGKWGLLQPVADGLKLFFNCLYPFLFESKPCGREEQRFPSDAKRHRKMGRNLD